MKNFIEDNLVIIVPLIACAVLSYFAWSLKKEAEIKKTESFKREAVMIPIESPIDLDAELAKDEEKRYIITE